jgi:two-component system response regulator LytT
MAYAELVSKKGQQSIAEEERIENEYLFLKVEYRLVRLPLNDIVYIEGLKDYVKVWLQGVDKPILSLTSLKSLEEKLPVKRFMRIHRSFIVSLDKINSISRGAVNIDKINIAVGEQYKEAFNVFISKWI